MKKKGTKAAALIVCAVLIMGAALAAGLASGDSLISLSYLDGTLIPDMVERGFTAAREKMDQISQAVSGALAELADSYLNKAGSSGERGRSDAYSRRTYSLYDVITLESGSGIIVEAGTLALSHTGTVVDVTTGTAADSGAVLIPGHRYLAAEETQATLTVESDAARAAVEGLYTVTFSGMESTPFTDINSSDSYHSAVNEAYRRGLFAGTGDGSIFAPRDKLERSMMMTVLFHLAGDPDAERFAATKTFTDIYGGEWYETYVRWAGQQGISAGYGDGSFKPTQIMNWQEIIQFLYNFGRSYLALDLPERADLSGYEGVEVLRQSGWGEEAMSWAAGAGIITSLRPQEYPDRSDVAVIMAAFAAKYL